MQRSLDGKLRIRRFAAVTVFWGLAVAVSACSSGSGGGLGADLLLVGVPSSNPDADNCVAHPDYGITPENASQTLIGQKIYTPLGNVNHYKLLQMLDHFGVDVTAVELIQSEGGSAAVAALASGEVALACAFGGAVNEMVAAGGHLLMTGEEMEAIGIRIYDLIVTTGAFAEANPDVVTGFLQVTIDANRAYNADREPMLDVIAETAGMELDAAVALLDGFVFTDRDMMLREDWMGGGVQRGMKQQMDFFVAAGEIDSEGTVVIGQVMGSASLLGGLVLLFRDAAALWQAPAALTAGAALLVLTTAYHRLPPRAQRLQGCPRLADVGGSGSRCRCSDGYRPGAARRLRGSLRYSSGSGADTGAGLVLHSPSRGAFHSVRS